MVRDINRDKDYWDDYIALKYRLIEKYPDELFQETRSIAHLMYSRGDDVALVKEKFVEALKEWHNHFEISDYYTNMEYIAIMVLCDMDTSWVLDTLKEYEAKDPESASDCWLLHFLASKGKADSARIPDGIKYDPIKEFVETNDINLIKTFMKTWYNKSRDCVWWGDHKLPNDRFCYEGYWNFEGAAVVKLLGLNKDEFKDYKYFPYDLV